MSARPVERLGAAAVSRLGALAPLDAEAHAALAVAIQLPRRFGIRRELLSEGREITETILILSGWGARTRLLHDGRRQIMSFLLPGDLIGLCDQDRPIASSSVVAITEMEVCVAPDPSRSPTLARAYAHSRAIDEAHLLAQITRLGRLNAHERLADLLLELFERLELAGLVAHGSYQLPVTQETLADALGLTSVHVNRTLQALRREGTLNWKRRDLVLTNPDALRRSTGQTPVRVTASCHRHWPSTS